MLDDKLSKTKSKLAIFSFVCSLIPYLSFLFIFYFGTMSLAGNTFLIITWTIIISDIVAFITSIVSLVKIKKYNLGGNGYAMAGLVISAILLSFIAILFIVASSGYWGLF